MISAVERSSVNRESYLNPRSPPVPESAPEPRKLAIEQDLGSGLNRLLQHLEVLERLAANYMELIESYRFSHNALINSIDGASNGNMIWQEVMTYSEAIRRAERKAHRDFGGFKIEKLSLGVKVDDILGHVRDAVRMLRGSDNLIQRCLRRLRHHANWHVERYLTKNYNRLKPSR